MISKDIRKELGPNEPIAEAYAVMIGALLGIVDFAIATVYTYRDIVAFCKACPNLLPGDPMILIFAIHEGFRVGLPALLVALLVIPIIVTLALFGICSLLDYSDKRQFFNPSPRENTKSCKRSGKEVGR